ncbi:MAG: hypothetical protein ACREMO_08430 [Gemmatimonadales bacterium]
MSDPPPGSSPPPVPRQARLKQRYAALYPGVEPEHWVPATSLLATFLPGLLPRTDPPPIVEVRLLTEEHFDFQGGNPGPAPGRKSRRTDRP